MPVSQHSYTTPICFKAAQSSWSCICIFSWKVVTCMRDFENAGEIALGNKSHD